MASFGKAARSSLKAATPLASSSWPERKLVLLQPSTPESFYLI